MPGGASLARAYGKLGTLSVGSGVTVSWDRVGLSPAQAAEQTRLRAYGKLWLLSVGSGVTASWDRAGLSPAQAAEQTRLHGPTESWGRCRPGQA
ncbi:TPA: hypothetical protein ACGQW1_000940 [Raoultella planticola]